MKSLTALLISKLNHHPIRRRPRAARRADLTRYGEVAERCGGSIKFKIKRDRVIPVCKALLDELPVSDIDIEEVPIEDVIRQIFAR